MAAITLLAPQTAAVTSKGIKYTAQQKEAVFLADGLATTETITPYVGSNGAWTALFDSSGTQIKLTATKPQLILPGGGCQYAFEKDATAGAAGLSVVPINFS